jgi:hypothetical protein
MKQDPKRKSFIYLLRTWSFFCEVLKLFHLSALKRGGRGGGRREKVRIPRDLFVVKSINIDQNWQSFLARTNS